eukprot:TRINITY_DN33295_c1_g1_i1.p1 TRINITY_DN33295_c1_g1~~TRINITY_DN33295_c1_g1_i1.p1  ORF type:complete len:578 (-),score=71.32 TRINITY_DN33295_c1_g1_i1:49-1782(-)
MAATASAAPFPLRLSRSQRRHRGDLRRQRANGHHRYLPVSLSLQISDASTDSSSVARYSLVSSRRSSMRSTGSRTSFVVDGDGSMTSSAGSPFIQAHEILEFSSRGHGSWEDYVMLRWTIGRGDCGSGGLGPQGNADLPEYTSAREMICLDWSLIRESRVARTLAYLRSESASMRRANGRGASSVFRGSVADVLEDFHFVFEPSLLLALKKAFGLRTDADAWNERRAIPVVADHEGNFFDAAVTMWAALPVWKKPVMSAALRELLTTEDPTGLQIVLGMMKESVNQCRAGKLDVWTRVLQRVGERQKNTWGGGRMAFATPEDSMPALRAARVKLWDECLAFVDDWKDRALRTVFVEPTKMYYFACGETELLENVEVHGSSMYVAVLLSTLGVRCPWQPFMLDTPISCVSFLDCLDPEPLRALWSPENFGKSFLSVPECSAPTVRTTLPNHYSNFIFDGRQPWQAANHAVEPSTVPERREKLRPYLEQFASYFSKEFLVPRLAQHLLANDETRVALQVVMDHLPQEQRELGRGSGELHDEENDVRFWLWNLEVLPSVLRLDRAVAVLRHAGILRPDLE